MYNDLCFIKTKDEGSKMQDERGVKLFLLKRMNTLYANKHIT